MLQISITAGPKKLAIVPYNITYFQGRYVMPHASGEPIDDMHFNDREAHNISEKIASAKQNLVELADLRAFQAEANKLIDRITAIEMLSVSANDDQKRVIEVSLIKVLGPLMHKLLKYMH